MTATPVDELEAVVAWLRTRLTHQLDVVRAGRRAGPTATVDALLAAAPATPDEPVPRLTGIEALATRLGLRAEERDLVAVLLVAAIEPGLGAAIGVLFDPRALELVSMTAVTRLLGIPRERWLTSEDASRRWRVVVDRGDAIELDPMLVARLLGTPARDAELVAQVQRIPPRPPLRGWPITELADAARRAIAAGARGVRLWCRGVAGSGRRTLFAGVARELGLVAVTTAIADAAGVRAVLRLARLDDLAIAWSNAVTVPSDLTPPVLQAWLGPEAPPPGIGIVDLTVAVPAVAVDDRRGVWTSIVPAFAGWSAETQAALTERWAARPGQLVALALAGIEDPADASASLHADAIQRLEGHCELLATPFEWADLVLPDGLLRALRELAFEARALPSVWADPEIARLFPQGRAVAALFCGAPGTGKTMAAQVLSRAIGLPLFRIDLSRLVSKYVGETSQNLARVLAAARDTDAVVFFDEADALFGRRTEIKDAHDRYANTETDYLLQALESWPGIAVLATNKRQHIDPAFSRRMRMILEFPHRDGAERLQLWRRLASAILPGAPTVEPMLPRLATTVEATGAQIKAALLTARLLAAHEDVPVDVGHVLRGIERELAKDGRSVSQRDRAAIVEGSG